MRAPQPLHYLKIARTDSLAAVCFVHGLSGSHQHTWQRFRELLVQDSEFDHCDIICWGYPTSLRPNTFLPIPLVGSRLPDIETVAETLYADLRNDEIAGRYQDLVLVGYSMGGLVVRSMILQALTRADGDTSVTSRIRHLLLYATPSDGVELPAVVKRHPQLSQLRWRSDFLERLTREWSQRVHPHRDTAPEKPGQALIPTTAIVGSEDNAVSKHSAGAFAHEVVTAAGNHISLINPASSSHTAFVEAKKRILGSTLPRLIKDDFTAVLAATRQIVARAESVLYAIGSRASDPHYLDAIGARLEAEPDLVYYRVLMGPPRHAALREHLLAVLQSSDHAHPAGHRRRLHIGAFADDGRQAEINLIGNERCVLVVLPSASGIGKYGSALILSDRDMVSAYRGFARQLYQAGTRFETPQAFQTWLDALDVTEGSAESG